MSIYQSAVRKPVTTALIYVALAVIGIFSLSRLSVDFLPSMSDNTILVMTTYSGASAADIENNVTKVLESTLSSVSNLKHITTQTKENSSLVVLEFEYGIDITEATNDVRDRLNLIADYLPEDANTPVLFKFGTDDIPIMILSVQAQESMNGLYKILDNRVASPLSRIKGVGTVSIAGAPVREIQVYCDPYKLEAYNLTVEGIASTIAYENRNTPGGNLDIGSETLTIRMEGEFKDPRQMENIIIGHFQGRNIFLSDVARVEDIIQERSQETFINGVQGGIIVIQKQAGANTVQICKKILQRLPELQENLPSDISIGIVMDSSDNINRVIDSLIQTIMITLILVVFIVLFFLGRWRATLIVAIVIPVSLVAAFIYLLISGNTLNIISLSSLSIAIGMVVDDAIVALENITTHIERGTKPKSAAVYATNEVSISIIASTLTLLAVFIPLTMVGGMSGEIFSQLGWIVAIISSVSTIAALTLTPMMSSQLLRLKTKKSKGFDKGYQYVEKALNALDLVYAKALGWTVRHRITVILASATLFIASLFLFFIVPTEFFPQQDNARLQMTVKLPINTRAEITKELSFRIYEQFRRDYPEIEAMTFTVGQASEDNVYGQLGENGSHIMTGNIRLSLKTERKRSIQEISDAMRYDLKRYYPEIRTFNVGAGMGGPTGGQTTVDLEIYGNDFSTTDAIASHLADLMEAVPGTSQVTISRDEYSPEYLVEFDREKLAQHGLNLSTASQFVRNRINGATASYYREEGDEYYIKVRYAPEYRQTLEDVQNILIYNSQGQTVRVRDVAVIGETMQPPTIERKDRERIVTVTCVAAKGAALSDLVTAARRQIDKVDIPPEVMVNIAGSYEDQQESFRDLAMLMILILILVYIVMAAQFESFSSPFIIMFSVPFALTGVLAGLALSGTALGIMSMVGLMMLFGIVVKNGIVLIDYIVLCRERGMSIMDAVVTSGRSRLRPILMTALTTIFGMVPLAVGRGVGAEMWNGLGVTVASGLTVSTLVTLFLIPAIYSLTAERADKRKKNRAERRQRHAIEAAN
ncbi:MAG: efflux RND transporter permease subunit [Bacteroidales bacterium]|jgi:HAE1 family hydrophobic/amphiphilic exporter-1|nr:efflux RND transporter permease subunit [Bacteroidales bacterium]MDD2264685.1 efflux RND transporter permease subunit [Bacteroidales bacterium]MDD2832251.1 efflux RND transporter permease subunit [Bacteroidales bacterium]MDD3209088.1 efflux RND transporter permease subunit [Bacteroidales bacterium]MDD3697904.1 efflux RND transporter permease subunit [Bacteroidales bacterium]